MSDPAQKRAPDAGRSESCEARWLESRLALRPREAAKALGLSERALRALLPSLPHFRAGGAVLIPLEPLRRWLEERAKAEREHLAAVEEELAARIREEG